MKNAAHRPLTGAPAWAAATLAVLCAAGCGERAAEASDTPGPAQEAPDAAPAHPAAVAAAEILRCIKENDVAGMRPLLNATNQRMDDEDIAGFLAEAGEDLKDVDAIVELRAIPDDDSEAGGAWAKLYDGDEEVFVFVLTLEDGKYLFEDINSPGTRSYEAAALIE